MAIRAHKLTQAVAAGSAGSAVATVTSNIISGLIHAIYVAQAGTPAATTDITISIVTPALAVLTLTNVTSSGWYYPRVLGDGSTGADLTGWYDRQPVDGYMTAAIAQGDAAQTLDVTIFVEV